MQSLAKTVMFTALLGLGLVAMAGCKDTDRTGEGGSQRPAATTGPAGAKVEVEEERIEVDRKNGQVDVEREEGQVDVERENGQVEVEREGKVERGLEEAGKGVGKGVEKAGEGVERAGEWVQEKSE